MGLSFFSLSSPIRDVSEKKVRFGIIAGDRKIISKPFLCGFIVPTKELQLGPENVSNWTLRICTENLINLFFRPLRLILHKIEGDLGGDVLVVRELIFGFKKKLSCVGWTVLDTIQIDQNQ